MDEQQDGGSRAAHIDSLDGIHDLPAIGQKQTVGDIHWTRFRLCTAQTNIIRNDQIDFIFSAADCELFGLVGRHLCHLRVVVGDVPACYLCGRPAPGQ